jgi:hypothetical protein
LYLRFRLVAGALGCEFVAATAIARMTQFGKEQETIWPIAISPAFSP